MGEAVGAVPLGWLWLPRVHGKRLARPTVLREALRAMWVRALASPLLRSLGRRTAAAWLLKDLLRSRTKLLLPLNWGSAATGALRRTRRIADGALVLTRQLLRLCVGLPRLGRRAVKQPGEEAARHAATPGLLGRLDLRRVGCLSADVRH